MHPNVIRVDKNQNSDAVKFPIICAFCRVLFGIVGRFVGESAALAEQFVNQPETLRDVRHGFVDGAFVVGGAGIRLPAA